MTEERNGQEGRIEERLARITGTAPKKRPRVNPWAFGAGGAVVGLATGAYIVAVAPDLGKTSAPVETSTVAEFGDGAMGLDGFRVRPEAAREDTPKIAVGPSPEVEKLQALVDSLTAKIAELERNPKTIAVADDAALKGLRAELSEIQGQLTGKDQALAAEKSKGDEMERQLMQLQGQLETERLMADRRAEAEKTRAEQQAELERRRQAAEDQRQAQITSPMVAWRAGGGSGAGGGNSETAGDAGGKYLGADGFIRASARPVATKQAEVIANPSHTIMQGTLIEAALETAINSDLPGAVAAVVTSDVWSFDMSQVLIPRGSRLFGRYDSDVGVGQRRILIAWNRIVTTDGQSVDLAAYGTDGLGRSGLPARVRSHFLQKFGAATLLSVIGAIPDLASSEASNDSGVSIIKDMGDNMEGATDSAIGDYLEIPPTLSTDQGAVVMVRVDGDLEFY